MDSVQLERSASVLEVEQRHLWHHLAPVAAWKMDLHSAHSALGEHSASVLAAGQIPHEHRQEGLVDGQRRAGSQIPSARAGEIPTFQHMAWGTVWKDPLAFPVQAMR